MTKLVQSPESLNMQLVAVRSKDVNGRQDAQNRLLNANRVRQSGDRFLRVAPPPRAR